MNIFLTRVTSVWTLSNTGTNRVMTVVLEDVLDAGLLFEIPSLNGSWDTPLTLFGYSWITCQPNN